MSVDNAQRQVLRGSVGGSKVSVMGGGTHNKQEKIPARPNSGVKLFRPQISSLAGSPRLVFLEILLITDHEIILFRLSGYCCKNLVT